MKIQLVSVAIAFIVASYAWPQWVTQRIPLTPGWNAVHLDVLPEPNDADHVLEGVPAESVWAWDRNASSIQFLQDPREMLAPQPEWLTWFPSNHPQAFLRGLHLILGGQAYLVKLPDDASPVTWEIRGRAALPKYVWHADSFNLVGLPVTDSEGPTFQQFFAPSSAHRGQPVYTLLSDGRWERIADLAATRISRGKAYWIRCSGASRYAGPLEVSAGGARAIECGENAAGGILRIRNNAAAAATCTIRLLASEAPPGGSSAPLAGPVALAYWNADFSRQRFAWETLPPALTKPLGPGLEYALELHVRRTDMAGPAVSNALYQSILEVTDGEGSRVLVPFTAKGLPVRGPGDATPLPRPGLWVGSALLNAVSEVNGSSNPVPAFAPLRFRLLVHQDSNGVARLLQQASIMPRLIDGRTNYVIVTDGRLAAQQAGAVTDANTVPGQRFSSAVFGFAHPQMLSYNQAAGSLAGTVFIGYNDPLNPFKHLYHPDHNNLDNYTATLSEGVQSYDVYRAITLRFSTNFIGSDATASWGDTVVGGEYAETLTGLYHMPLKVAGSFTLGYVTPVTQLDPAP